MYTVYKVCLTDNGTVFKDAQLFTLVSVYDSSGKNRYSFVTRIKARVTYSPFHKRIKIVELGLSAP